MIEKSLRIQGSVRNVGLAALCAALLAVIGLACGFFVVRDARAAGSLGDWFGVVTMSVVALLCVYLGIRYGAQALTGARVVVLVDEAGISVDRSRIGGGKLRVRWSDVESIFHEKLAVGLVLRSHDSLLRESDEAELKRLANTRLLLKLGALLKASSGPTDALEVLTASGGPSGGGGADSELQARTRRALVSARKLGGYEVQFPIWEWDRGPKAIADLLEEFRSQASRAGAPPV